jgi:hypothetical protein
LLKFFAERILVRRGIEFVRERFLNGVVKRFSPTIVGKCVGVDVVFMQAEMLADFRGRDIAIAVAIAPRFRFVGVVSLTDLLRRQSSVSQY